MDLLGVLAGNQGQPDDGVLVDTDQAAGLADAATFLPMLEDREGFVVGKFGAIERGALAFGEAFLAGAAGQDAALLVGSVAEADTQVVATALTVVGTVGVLAAEGFQGVRPSTALQDKDC